MQATSWLPAAFGLLVICCESTRVMGADHTLRLLSRLCTPLMNLAGSEVFELNHVLRKLGHLFGYGTLGLVLMQGWLSLLLKQSRQTGRRLRLLAGTMATFSVALVAGADELHQSFLPNRTACFSDVLLDTAGAVLLLSVAALVRAMQRRRTLTRLLQLRSYRAWRAGAWLFRDALLELR